jgi:Arc/MetJ-type ribon-helix-helix transcriptional regulator
MPSVVPLPDRRCDTEKITINLGPVDLGRVDLLVQDGFYSNRTDLIRTAIRNQIASHSEEMARSIARQTFELGLIDLDATTLREAVAKGERLALRVVGLVRIAADVTPDLAIEAIDSLTVLGTVQASRDVKKALADRLR